MGPPGSAPVFFIDPSSSNFIFDIVCNTLFSIDQSHFSNFVIVGDFNVNFDSSHPTYRLAGLISNQLFWM